MNNKKFDILYQAAADLISARHRPGIHSVSAAVMGTSGKIYTSVNLDCYLRRAGVCAEPGAIAAAMSAGETSITAILAVRHNAETGKAHLVSPCGICRELIADYGPDAEVFAPDHASGAHKYSIQELLPNRYAKQGKHG